MAGRARERRLKAQERNAHRLYAEFAREARMGLSRRHIRPHYWAEVAPHGSLLGVKDNTRSSCPGKTHARGSVRSFSAKSRRRMLRTFALLKREDLSQSLLVTLTYPRSFPAESSTFKRHFHTFSKRLLRTFPMSYAVWKLEYQLRGAPHYHLMVMGVPFIAKGWLSRAWYQIVGSNDERHLRAGTQVQRVRGARKAYSYASKYVAKVSTSAPDDHSGRFWGLFGRRNSAICRHTWPLERSGHARLARFIRNLASSRSRQHSKRRYNASWIFADGRRGIEAIKWAAGLPWNSLPPLSSAPLGGPAPA